MNENQTQENMQETTQEAVQLPTMAHNTSIASADQYAITSGNASPVYCTIDDSTKEGKKHLYHVKNRPDHTISEYIDKTIRIKDIYIDVNTRVVKDGEDAGLVEDKPRTILIDENGESYIAGVSIGIYNAVKEIIRTFGDPKTWDEPLEVMVVNVKTPKGNMLSLDVV